MSARWPVPSWQWVRRLSIPAVYLAVALLTTWPLVTAPLTSVPVGDFPAATVPLFNAWTIWWNADRLWHGFAGYWQAPIFFPAHDAFAFSEPQPVTLLVAPVLWLTGSRILAYNVYLWLSLALNGVFAERLLRIVGIGRWAAVLGGLLAVVLPFVYWQIDVVQLAPLWTVLWTWTAFWQAGRHRTWRAGAEAGIALGVAFLTCGHQGLFLTLLLAFTFWILPQRWASLRWWRTWAVGALVTAALVLPIAIPLQQAARAHGFQRTPELAARLSAKLGDYTAAPGRQWLNFGPLAARPGWYLSPGWFKVTLAGLGLVFGLSRRRWRRWTCFLGITLVLSVLFSLGPHLQFGGSDPPPVADPAAVAAPAATGWQPWHTLVRVVPGFSLVRNVFRFAIFAQLATILLAAQAVYFLQILVRCLLRTRYKRLCSRALVCVLAIPLVGEVWPTMPTLASIPDVRPHRDWIDFVRLQTPAGKGVLCLPFPTGTGVGDYEQTAKWMYFGTFHGRPLVNGYSGFFPNDHFELRDALQTSFPAPSLLQRLANQGVEFIVIDPAAFPLLQRNPGHSPEIRLVHVLTSQSGALVYRIQQRPTPRNAAPPQ